jgi:hypothetical protein
VDDPASDRDPVGVELSEAIEALRAALVRSWWDGRRGRVRFRMEPVELTVQLAVTRTDKGSAGVKWHVLNVGGERSKEAAATQTLVFRLAPVLFDAQGQPLPEDEQLISDLESDADDTAADRATPEPEQPAVAGRG